MIYAVQSAICWRPRDPSRYGRTEVFAAERRSRTLRRTCVLFHWPPKRARHLKRPPQHHLYLYVNKAPNKPLDPIVREFIKFIYSKEGQTVVIKDGFFPLKADLIERELRKLD